MFRVNKSIIMIARMQSSTSIGMKLNPYLYAPSTIHQRYFSSWVDKVLPPKLQPYAALARVDKPIGTYLLMFPGWWSIAIAAPPGHLPDFKLWFYFAAGAFLMRSAGCAVNDMWDRDFDKRVERTKERPIASGKISMFEAATFVGASSLTAFTILLQFNMLSIKLGVLSLLPVAAYPLAKRFIGYPQLVLGFTMNWGAIMGYTAATDSLDWSIVGPLYLGSACWTMMYDTIYAHQDKHDDVKIGVKSSALSVGDEKAKPFLYGCSAATLALWTLAGVNAGIGSSIPFLASIAGSGLHMGYQIYTADLNDRGNLMRRFASNRDIGILLAGGIAGAKYFAM